MSTNSLDSLRALQKRAARINTRTIDDLQAFLHDGNKLTFRRLPTQESKTDEINVTSTCTALMTLTVTRKLYAFYGDRAATRKPQDAFELAVKYPKWASSDLIDDNAFTTTMVLRTAGVLASEAGISRDTVLAFMHKGRTLKSIAEDLLAGLPKSLQVQGYPPTPTLGYWLIDAIDRLQLDMPADSWRRLATWTTRDFWRQMSLLTARHDAMMDPVAMAMAACVAARLRRLVANQDTEWARELATDLPSEVELREAVRKLFGEQASSGIWPKYFPLFHYPDVGANYTFTFEFLEAVLHEFGSDTIAEPVVLDGLERAVGWCENNRLEYRHQNKSYVGWNSGGHLPTLSQGLPESWATGVVHMFLFALGGVLSNAIHRQILDRYAGTPHPVAPNRKRWESMIDTTIHVANSKTTVRQFLEEHMLRPLQDVRSSHDPLPRRRSALLFGPPGTSKTTLVRSFAEAVGWSYVEINPSHFLSLGLDGIYVRANEIFADLMDLSNAVVLFDEMDALVRRRAGDDSEQPLDVTREFLTTSMLPKLAELHDRARVVFFMATNHQRYFDEAIKRPGRFDLHVFMGVPDWGQKRARLDAFLPQGTSDADVKRAGEGIDKYLAEYDALPKLLDLFSFGELRAFMDDFISRGSSDLSKTFAEDRRKDFRESVEYWGARLIVLRAKQDPDNDASRRNPTLEEYERDRSLSRIQ